MINAFSLRVMKSSWASKERESSLDFIKAKLGFLLLSLRESLLESATKFVIDFVADFGLEVLFGVDISLDRGLEARFLASFFCVARVVCVVLEVLWVGI